MFGLHQALLACHNLIQGRMCCVFSDSIYVVRAIMSLELTALPARIRSMVLDIRVNYNVSVAHLSGNLNITADILSRYGIPSSKGGSGPYKCC